VFTAAATPDTKLVDPLVVMIAEGRDGLSARRKAEILARFGRYDHAGVAVNRHADVYTLGRKLPELLDRRTKRNLFAGTRRRKCSNMIALRCFGLCSGEN